MKSEILSTVFWLKTNVYTAKLLCQIPETLPLKLRIEATKSETKPWSPGTGSPFLWKRREDRNLFISESGMQSSFQSLTHSQLEILAQQMVVKTSIPIVCLGRIQMFDFLNCISVIPTLGCILKSFLVFSLGSNIALKNNTFVHIQFCCAAKHLLQGASWKQTKEVIIYWASSFMCYAKLMQIFKSPVIAI